MDTTKTTTHIGLCAGYGGIELGIKRVIPNLRSVALCEIEAFACANLVAKMEAGFMDAAPIWSDLKTFPWAEFRGKVDILTGGYPCQPFSSAGKRAGKDDPRHLWPWIADGIRIMRPRACFFENVEGHISLGLSSVISDLEEMGYRVAWGIFSASEVGAPHQRKRVFICAVANCIPEGLQRRSRESSDQGRLQRQARRSGDCVWSSRPGELADSECSGLRAVRGNAGTEEESKFKYCNTWPSRPGEPQHEWEPPRVVANSKGERARERSELCNKECGSGSTLSRDVEQSGERVVGNSEDGNQSGDALQLRQGETQHRGASGSFDSGRRQAEPKVGRDVDGAPDWLDYAELCVTSDNRTDELRLLGNGVVPATAEKAFCVLMQKLDENK